MYRVRYTFAGASGAKTYYNKESAEAEASSISKHYLHQAEVWIERICIHCHVPLTKSSNICGQCHQNIKKYKDQYNAI